MAEDSRNNPRRSERIGKYEILEHIASGGMGAVYKAMDTDLQRLVALKVLSPELAVREHMIKRFRKEAQAAAKLRHENIVSIYDVGEFSGTHYLALEFIEGTDLYTYITRKGRLSPEEARQICVQATRALVHAHEQGIVHRDIKPSNFLLTTTKEHHLLVKLTDLGLVKHVDDDELRLTLKGTTVGTVDYMAPEQARNSGDADIRSDIYSLGCTFYHMLAGSAPFPRGSLTERILQHIEAEPPDVRRLNKAVPEPMIHILTKMLAKRPEDRFQSPQALLKELERIGRLANGKQAEEAIADLESLKRLPGGEPTVALGAVNTRMAKQQLTRPPKKEKDSSGELKTRIDEDAASRRDKKKLKKVESSLPAWWPYAAGGGVVGLLLLVMTIYIATRPRRPDTVVPIDPPPIVEKKIEQPPPIVKPPPPPVVEVDTDPNHMSAGELELATLANIAPDDRTKLRKFFVGSFQTFPDAPSKSRVLQVGRTIALGPLSFRSLASALLAPPPAEGPTVIEVLDVGPIFLSSLPPMTNRRIFLRAAPGYRPLLVWDLSGTVDGRESLITFNGGELILENLDILARWPDPRTEPPALIQMNQANFFARGCTFSVAGKHPRGIALVRLTGDGTKTRTARCHFLRSLIRGTDVIAIAHRDTVAETLIENSLLASFETSLVQAQGRADLPIELRLVRSTLVSGRNFVDWQCKEGPSPLHGYALDSILALNGSSNTEGVFFQLNAQADQLTWLGVNSIYAGWKKLLTTNAQTILGHDLTSWRKATSPDSEKQELPFKSSDKVLAATWPEKAAGSLFDEIPSVAFDQYASNEVAYAARSATGAIGCPLGLLPKEPSDWLRQTYDRRQLTPSTVRDSDEEPKIDLGNGGLYPGEKIDLKNVKDLGQHLNVLLQKPNLAPRVVFHILGSGEIEMSPVQVKAAVQLILYFPPVKDTKEPLVLTVNGTKSVNKAALFEVENGSLELINAVIRYSNYANAIMPAYVVKLQGGDLSLNHCYLQGPMNQVPNNFKALIGFYGSKSTTKLNTLQLRETVLLCGKPLLQLQDPGIVLKARQNLGYSLNSAIQVDMQTTEDLPAPSLSCFLEQNTWAAQQSFFNLRTSTDWPLQIEAFSIHALGNYFMTPFEDVKQSAFIRYPEPAIARGQLVWRGRRNAFDIRMTGFYEPLGRDLEKQSLKDWIPVWGQLGEQNSISVDVGKLTVDRDRPQLERLRYSNFEAVTPVPGADHTRLCLPKLKS